ncbi:MAG: archease [Anaerolineales bacterium]|jgi:SHS2 domain-containing protein
MLDCGFLELEHTADWALQVWAPDNTSLLVTAAKGMYSLLKIKTDANEYQNIVLRIGFIDYEGLLVDFLSELILLGELENIAAVNYDLKLENSQLIAKIQAAKILSQQKEIKAVTYHNLKIIRAENRLETVIIFDV